MNARFEKYVTLSPVILLFLNSIAMPPVRAVTALSFEFINFSRLRRTLSICKKNNDRNNVYIYIPRRVTLIIYNEFDLL